MTKITVYSDLHLYSPIALDIGIPVSEHVILEDNIWLLGDIHDRKSCDRKDKDKLEFSFDLITEMYKHRYLVGNHEMMGYNISRDFVKVGNILLTHGDRICWHDIKSDAFRNGEAYQGYGMIKRFINWFRQYWTQTINSFEVEQATKYCKQYGCNVIIYGHSHSKKLLIKKVNGITIYNVPRGKTVLDV